MKVALVLAAVCSLGLALTVAPATVNTPWTLEHIVTALENPNTNPAIVPALETALNEIMIELVNGQQPEHVMVPIPVGAPLELSPVVAGPAIVQPSPAVENIPWTLENIVAALENPNTNPAIIPSLENGLNVIMNELMNGQQPEAVMVPMPAGVPLEVAPVPASPAIVNIPWTLDHIVAALENPNTNPAIIPSLEQGLNEIMNELMNGQQPEAVMVPMPAGVPLEVAPVPVHPVQPSPAVVNVPWTLDHIVAALENPNTNPAIIPSLEHSLNEIMNELMNGQQTDVVMVAMPVGVPLELAPVDPVPVITPVGPATVDIPWTLETVVEALENPNTNPALIPTLESALNEIMSSLMSGQQVETVMVPMPVGVPLEVSPIADVPVIQTPVADIPVIQGPIFEVPVIQSPAGVPVAQSPADVQSPQSSANPLVQIILNINQDKAGEANLVSAY